MQHRGAGMGFAALLALPLALGAVPGAAQKNLDENGRASRGTDVAGRVIVPMIAAWRESARAGFGFGTHYGMFWTLLTPGAHAREGFTVTRGKTYRFVAVGDQSVDDLELRVGGVVRRIRKLAASNGRVSVVQYVAPRSGRVLARVQLAGARDRTAFVGLLAMEQESGPRTDSEMQAWDTRVAGVFQELGGNLSGFADGSEGIAGPPVVVDRPVPWMIYFVRISGKTAIRTDPTDWGAARVNVRVSAEQFSPITVSVVGADRRALTVSPKSASHAFQVDTQGQPISVQLDRLGGERASFAFLLLTR